MITNLTDLAAHLGARDEDSIASRLSKHSEVSFFATRGRPVRTVRTVLQFKAKRSLVGYLLVAWRTRGKAWQRIAGLASLPEHVREYVEHDVRVTPGGHMVLSPEAEQAFGQPLRREPLTRLHTSDGPVEYTVPTGPQSTVLCFTGTEDGCMPYEVRLPASTRRVDAAIDAAQRDGAAAYDATHCAACGEETGWEEACECQADPVL